MFKLVIAILVKCYINMSGRCPSATISLWLKRSPCHVSHNCLGLWSCSNLTSESPFWFLYRALTLSSFDLRITKNSRPISLSLELRIYWQLSWNLVKRLFSTYIRLEILKDKDKSLTIRHIPLRCVLRLSLDGVWSLSSSDISVNCRLANVWLAQTSDSSANPLSSSAIENLLSERLRLSA